MRTVLSKAQIAYDQGYASYVEGIERSLNPYGVGTEEYHQWFAGWDRGLECGGTCDG